MDIWIIIATIAVILTSIQILPQVIKSFKTKQVDDVSLWMILIIIFGSSLWLAYGIHIEDTPVIAANTINLTFTSILLILKIKYGT